MPTIDNSSHLGIIRSTSRTETENRTVDQNITKARRTSYSLMSTGLHANSGLDPNTSVAIIKCYILPILTYGLEVIQPRAQNLLKLEQFLKSLLKRVLSLPPNTPDPALYVISGILPVQAQIDTKCLTLFNNICRQPGNMIENKLAFRQLNMIDNDSSSWFNVIKHTLMKYQLQHPLDYLENPMCKHPWKKLIQKHINEYWKNRIIQDCEQYTSLRYLDYMSFIPNSCHPIVNIDNNCNPSREAMLIAIKLKMASGSYILQQKRAKFTKTETPICKLCEVDIEDMEHFIIHCVCLQSVRLPYIRELENIFKNINNKDFSNMSTMQQTKIILDCTFEFGFIDSKKVGPYPPKEKVALVNMVHKITRRLCFDLHTARTRMLKPKKQ